MKRFPASVISGTAVAPQIGSAPGIWSKEQQIQAQQQGLWAANPSLVDPYFPYVSMLLHGDGTNAAQNNTFLDSSTNNFAITRNGNPTQGSFSPFGTLWSNYFDGTGDYLNAGSSANFAFGTSAYTVEFFVNPATLTSNHAYVRNNATGGFLFYWDTTNGLSAAAVGSSAFLTAGASSLLVGQWQHVAVCRNSTSANDTRIFVNGVLRATGTDAANWTVAGALTIGADSTGATPFRGNISNLRILKGTALYTSGFTPPSSPLTVISNTVLLTCQSNRFVDNSSTAAVITRNGDTVVSRFSPFAPGSDYNTSTVGGSGYFDGTGDYLSSTLTSQAPGTGNFTYECYFYVTSLAANRAIMNTRSGATTDGFDVVVTTAGAIAITYSGATLFTSASSAATIGQWSHLAIVRTSTSTVTVYLNGVSLGDWTSGASQNFTSTTLFVGAAGSAGTPMFGYIGSFRYTKSAVYTAAFTPPTAPLPAIANTAFLAQMTNGAVFDNAMITDLETVGTAQISTSVVKYGTGSIYFQGSGNRLSTPPNQPQLAFGAGDFTVEAWVYRTVSANGTILCGQGDGASVAGSSYAFYVSASATSDLYVGSGSYAVTSPNPSLNQWAHVAFVRNGTSYKSYLNGVQVGTATLAAGAIVNVGSATYPPTIGTTGTNANTLVGYIDDLRVTKGVARYTSNFTPPTAAFSNQ